MNRRPIILTIGILAGVILFFWWKGTAPAPIVSIARSPDLLAKSATKTNDGWTRTNYEPDNTKAYTTYQEKKLLIYGQGTLPNIRFSDPVEIDIPEKSQWIIRSLDPDMTITVNSNAWSGTLSGRGGVYFDTDKKIVANFDTAMKDQKNAPLLPAFSLSDGKKEFFDLSEAKNTIIDPDIWSLYTVFLPRDTLRILGTVTKKDIDTMISSQISREPESATGFFPHDLRVRNALDELRQVVAKIENEESCGVDVDACFFVLNDIFAKYESKFPEVFSPLKSLVNSWLLTNTDISSGSSWQDIFHQYHDDIVSGEARARSVRDRAILAMIRTGKTNAYFDIWQYLTQMLAGEKSGSVYSMQIMTEMIRIGEGLRQSSDIGPEIKTQLAQTTIASLTNLRNILEDAYFTKKDYYFILRSDLVDTQGKVIQVDTLIKDLKTLIDEIDHSALLQLESHTDESKKSLAVVRGQLAWFNCIFSRHSEYVANPRVCRVTISE